MFTRWSALALVAAISVGGPAQAGLIGNSIVSLDYNSPDLTAGSAAPQIELTSQTSNYPFTIGASGLYFLTGGANSPIHMGDTQIVIGSNQEGPYCNGSLPCADAFDGFRFVFSSGVNITGVSIDGVTPSNSGWRDATINLISGTELDIDLKNVNSPALPTTILGDGSNSTELLNELSSALVLDLTFNGTGNNNAPEPATLSLFGAGLLGLAAARRRRRG